jgi:hypothetical protein
LINPAMASSMPRSKHTDSQIEWISDSLPLLDALQGRKFALILVSAVWTYVPSAKRQLAIETLATLTEVGGCVAITLRSSRPTQNEDLSKSTLGLSRRNQPGHLAPVGALQA